MDEYLTDNNLTSDDVVEISGNTYVVVQITKNAETGLNVTKYSIFRKMRKPKGAWLVHVAGPGDDDVDLSEEQFLKTEILGGPVMDAPIPVGGAAKGASLIVNGGKNIYYSFRGIVGTVERASKELVEWKSKTNLEC